MAEEVAIRKKRMGRGAAKVRTSERLFATAESKLDDFKKLIIERQVQEEIDKSHAISRVKDASTPYLVPDIQVESRDFNIDFSNDFAY